MKLTATKWQRSEKSSRVPEAMIFQGTATGSCGRSGGMHFRGVREAAPYKRVFDGATVGVGVPDDPGDVYRW